MHMHMTMRGRDAAVDRIDIADKLSGRGPLVNAIPSLRQSISTMSRELRGRPAIPRADER